MRKISFLIAAGCLSWAHAASAQDAKYTYDCAFNQLCAPGGACEAIEEPVLFELEVLPTDSPIGTEFLLTYGEDTWPTESDGAGAAPFVWQTTEPDSNNVLMRIGGTNSDMLVLWAIQQVSETEFTGEVRFGRCLVGQ
ncbi:MAG: hypothetical protein AAFX00_05445 [Pseudomonadota bacterium]